MNPSVSNFKETNKERKKKNSNFQGIIFQYQTLSPDRYLQVSSYSFVRFYLGIYMYIEAHVCIHNSDREFMSLKKLWKEYMGVFGD